MQNICTRGTTYRIVGNFGEVFNLWFCGKHWTVFVYILQNQIHLFYQTSAHLWFWSKLPLSLFMSLMRFFSSSTLSLPSPSFSLPQSLSLSLSLFLFLPLISPFSLSLSLSLPVPSPISHSFTPILCLSLLLQHWWWSHSRSLHCYMRRVTQTNFLHQETTW